jgi:hypothetical protein
MNCMAPKKTNICSLPMCTCENHCLLGTLQHLDSWWAVNAPTRVIPSRFSSTSGFKSVYIILNKYGIKVIEYESGHLQPRSLKWPLKACKTITFVLRYATRNFGSFSPQKQWYTPTHKAIVCTLIIFFDCRYQQINWINVHRVLLISYWRFLVNIDHTLVASSKKWCQ